MTRTAHVLLKMAEDYFPSRRALADTVDMPRTTLVGWLDAEVGERSYAGTEENDDRISQVLFGIYQEGGKEGFEKGQRAEPDIPPNEQWTRDGDTVHTIRNVGEPVYSEEKAAEFFGIDTDRYHAAKIQCGQHEVPMKIEETKVTDVDGSERLIKTQQGVKVRCYRLNVTWKPHDGRRMASAFCQAIMDGYEGQTPPAIHTPSQDGLIRSISIPDLHLGNLIWAEDGTMEWNLDIGTEQFRQAWRYLTEGAEEEGVTDLILDIGNDAAHANSSRSESANGTPYAQVAPAHQTSEAMARMYMWAIEDAVERGLNMHAVVVRGNHDWDPADWMGRSLWMRYEDWDPVTIHRSAHPWVIRRFGKTLLGWTHGKNREGHLLKPADLYSLMAEKSGDDWARSEHKEWKTGHTHSRKLDRVGAYTEHSGVLVRKSPSLCPPDSFHRANLYVDALRAAEATDYHREHGEIKHVSYKPDLQPRAHEH